MTLYWIYDLPSWQLGILIVLGVVVGSLLGLALTRRPVAALVGPPPGINDLVSYFLSAYGVLYGLALGLIAVASWQNFSDIERMVVREASILGALYRDVSSYPEPERSVLQSALRDYTTYTIERAWPEQQRGRVPAEGVVRVTAFQQRLTAFEPRTAGQQVLHAATLRQFNGLVEARRERLQSVTTGLPATVWWVLVIGALGNIAMTYLFNVPSGLGHSVLVALLAGYIGLLIFLIAAMDNPFRGDFSISPDAFELIRAQLMAPAAVPVRP